jgi:8-oxo-dGTP pyrophosphatase MutT (NUDIX family)
MEKPVKLVRPRLAASLVLLRQGAGGLEVLLGRRGAQQRFMPGRYVFPGGGVAREDARPWAGEGALPSAPADRLRQRCARAALRETFEETGLVFGRDAPPQPPGADFTPVEAAMAAQGLAPALDLLTLIGRAITPTYHRIRFDAYFFLGDGRFTAGTLTNGGELEELRWHPVEHQIPEPMPRVTRYMLEHALAVRRGPVPAEMPFYTHIGTRPVVRRLPLHQAGGFHISPDDPV